MSEKATCNCWHETDNKLRGKGFKLHTACSTFHVDPAKLTLSAKFGLPIQTLDGKKPKRGQPNMVVISHCPFCGREL